MLQAHHNLAGSYKFYNVFLGLGFTLRHHVAL